MQTKNKYHFYSYLKSPVYINKKAFFSKPLVNKFQITMFQSHSDHKLIFYPIFKKREINRQLVCFAEQKKNEFNRNIEINSFKSIILDRYTWLITVGRLYLIMRNLKYYIRELLETQKLDKLTLWFLFPLMINVWQINDLKKTNSTGMVSTKPKKNTAIVFYLKSNLPGLTENYFSPKYNPLSLNEVAFPNSKERFPKFSKKIEDLDIYTKSNNLSWETFALTDYQSKIVNFSGCLNSGSNQIKTENSRDLKSTGFYDTNFILKTTNLWGNKLFRLYSLNISSVEKIPELVGFGRNQPEFVFSEETNQFKELSKQQKGSGPIYSLEFHENFLSDKLKFPTYWQTVDHIPKKLESLYSEKIISLVHYKNHLKLSSSNSKNWINNRRISEKFSQHIPSTLLLVHSHGFFETKDLTNFNKFEVLDENTKNLEFKKTLQENNSVLLQTSKNLIPKLNENSNFVSKNKISENQINVSFSSFKLEKFNGARLNYRNDRPLIRNNYTEPRFLKNVQEQNVQEQNVQEQNVQEQNVQEQNVQKQNVQKLRKTTFLAISSNELKGSRKVIKNLIKASFEKTQFPIVEWAASQELTKPIKIEESLLPEFSKRPTRFSLQNSSIQKSRKQKTFNKKVRFLQNKLIIFLSKNNKLDTKYAFPKADQILDHIWFNRFFGEREVPIYTNDWKISNNENQNTSFKSENKNKHLQHFKETLKNRLFDIKVPISKLYSPNHRNIVNIVNPRLMSGYFNPDITFFNFNLGSQIFNVEIPSIIFSQKNQKGSGLLETIQPNSSSLFQWEEEKKAPNLKLSYIDTKIKNVFGVYDLVQADFFAVYQNMKGAQETEQNNNKKDWIHSIGFPFRKKKTELEEIPQFLRNSKTQDVYLKNQNEFKKTSQLNFSYTNPFKDSLSEGFNHFGKSYSFANSPWSEAPAELRSSKNNHQESTTSESSDFKTSSKNNDYVQLKETLICFPQSRSPIPQLNLNLTEKMASYTISKVQLDSLVYSFQIPFRSKLEWSEHLESWKTRLSNWISAYQGISIFDLDVESYCCEFEQLITELIFTRINKNTDLALETSLQSKNWILNPKLILDNSFTKNSVNHANREKNWLFVEQPYTPSLIEVQKSLSYFDYQHFFYSIITPSESQSYIKQQDNSQLIGFQNSKYVGSDWNKAPAEFRSRQTEIYKFLPYAEGKMLDQFSPYNQGGIRFGSVSTVYGVNQNDPSIKHQMIYTGEPITQFSIGAIFQFSFFFSNIVFLKYFYKLYGKELIQFILSATGWLKEADENSQKEIGLNELEKALLVVNKPQKRLKNIAGIKSLLPEISVVIWFLRHAPKRVFWDVDYRLKVKKNRSSVKTEDLQNRTNEVYLNEVQKEPSSSQKKETKNKNTEGNKDNKALFIAKTSFGKKSWSQLLMKLQATDQTPLSLGNIVPKGILLIGPPGTGKTFLVQALAGESEVPALVQSAGFLVSDPQLGLTRLEYLLEQAQKLAPCIVFIDEIDTLGATRELVINNTISENTIMDMLYNQMNSKETLHSYNLFDSHQNNGQIDSNLGGSFESSSNNLSEDLSWSGQSDLMNRVSAAITNRFIAESEARKNQLSLLTQFLIEMDGLKAHKQILFIGATNRAAVLDPALTRPGRFEKVLKIDLPGKQKRIEILKLYSKNLGTNFADKKNWTYLANKTVGLSAADLAAIMNQSSIKAILNKLTYVFPKNSLSFQSQILDQQRNSNVKKLLPKLVDQKFEQNDFVLELSESVQTFDLKKAREELLKKHGFKNFDKLNKINDKFDHLVEKYPIHTTQTIEHGFNTIVNANKRQNIKFRPPTIFDKRRIISFKQLVDSIN